MISSSPLLPSGSGRQPFCDPTGPQGGAAQAANVVRLDPAADVLTLGAGLARVGSTGSGHAVRPGWIA